MLAVVVVGFARVVVVIVVVVLVVAGMVVKSLVDRGALILSLLPGLFVGMVLHSGGEEATRL